MILLGDVSGGATAVIFGLIWLCILTLAVLGWREMKKSDEDD